MNRILLCFFFLITTVCPPTEGSAHWADQSSGQAPPQAELNPWLRLVATGPWWSSLSPEKKWYFVDGYTEVMQGVRSMLLADAMAQSKASPPGDINSMMKMSVFAEFYDYDVDRGKLVTGLDEFYKDARNTRISIRFAVEYVRDVLNGKNAPRDLEKKINEWRAITNK